MICCRGWWCKLMEDWNQTGGEENMETEGGQLAVAALTVWEGLTCLAWMEENEKCRGRGNCDGNFGETGTWKSGPKVCKVVEG